MPPPIARPLSSFAVSLYLTPVPRSLADTQSLLRTVQSFGSVTAFKVLRNPFHLPTFTRRIEVLFHSPASAEALRRAAAANKGIQTEDGFDIRLLDGRWDHKAYLERAGGWMGLETGGVWKVRGSGVGGRGSGRGGKAVVGGFTGLKALREKMEAGKVV